MYSRLHIKYILKCILKSSKGVLPCALFLRLRSARYDSTSEFINDESFSDRVHTKSINQFTNLMFVRKTREVY